MNRRYGTTIRRYGRTSSRALRVSDHLLTLLASNVRHLQRDKRISFRRRRADRQLTFLVYNEMESQLGRARPGCRAHTVCLAPTVPPPRLAWVVGQPAAVCGPSQASPPSRVVDVMRLARPSRNVSIINLD